MVGTWFCAPGHILALSVTSSWFGFCLVLVWFVLVQFGCVCTVGSVYQFRIAAVYSNHDNKIGPISDRVSLKTGLPTSSRSRAPVTSPMIVDVHENITSFIVFWQVVEIFCLILFLI